MPIRSIHIVTYRCLLEEVSLPYLGIFYLELPVLPSMVTLLTSKACSVAWAGECQVGEMFVPSWLILYQHIVAMYSGILIFMKLNPVCISSSMLDRLLTVNA